jgi:SAM-dependent methyltransferase
MVYADPQPHADDLLAAYAAVEDPQYLDQQRGRELTFNKLARRLAQFVRPPADVLDVGCYSGVFLEAAADSGYRVRGLELSRWAAEIARSLAVGPVDEVALDKLELPASSLDVITMWDVIEHLPQPRQAVARVHELLRPGAVLALSTHLIDSPAARILGTRYPFLMDMHLVHFTRATLGRLLTELGFEIVGFEGHSRCVMLDYLLGRAGRMLPFSRPLLGPVSRLRPLGRLPVWVRGLGLVNVWAVKKGQR